MTGDQMFDVARSFRSCCDCKDEFERVLVETAALEAAYRIFYGEPGSDESAIEVGMSKLITLGAVDSFTKRMTRLYRSAFLTMTALARAGLTRARRI
ncbi:hypothetical protein QFZ94_003365 [Paraburkholderia sp. JPY465]|uniref:hypothetical protein n=1 Tax=Paraburkholderia sp. JPY465 TaxID=3042285 RepID=UPI003D203E20